MTIQGITTKIISTIGNKESLIPIIIKDGVDSTSLTYKSFKEGGPIEGKDRAIDEFGTQAIWVGGIPFYKKLIDKTAYKMGKINPEVDPRIIANKEYSEWAKANAKGMMSNNKRESVKKAIEDCLKDGGKKAKNLYKGKIIAATGLTLITYFLLTKFKQNKTKNTVIEKMYKDYNKTEDIEKEKIKEGRKTPEIFSEIKEINGNKERKRKTNIFSEINIIKGSDNITFRGKNIKKIVDGIMFNPVHNMKIIDGGITAERLGTSRNKTEFVEHGIKEFGFLFFLYGFGNYIEKGINKFSKDVLKKPIDISIDVILDVKFSKALSKGQLREDIKSIQNRNKTLKERLDYIISNQNNTVIEAAKKSKIIKTIKDGNGREVIDTSKYSFGLFLMNLGLSFKHFLISFSSKSGSF